LTTSRASRGSSQSRKATPRSYLYLYVLAIMNLVSNRKGLLVFFPPGPDRLVQCGFGDLEHPENVDNRVSGVIKLLDNTASLHSEGFWPAAFS
jgi:hypothetical protein